MRETRPPTARAIGRVATVLVLVAALCAVPSGRAPAQGAYPSRPIEFVIPFPPGGPADTAARIVQPHLAKALGVPIVLTNKPGGGGALAADYVAKARPDGYTVFASTNAPLTILPTIQPDVTYHAADFTPVGAYMADVGVITARAGAPWKTLDEVVAYAKANPGKLSYGSAGLGTVSFFMVELLKQAYGVDIVHVPFQGAAVKNAVMGGHVALGATGLSTLASLIRSGDLIGLVSTATRPIREFPAIPTMAAKGVPDASLNIWMALFVPARTPPAIGDTLWRVLQATMREPSVLAAVDKASMVVDVRDAAATTRLIDREHAAVAAVVTRLGIGKR